jgi:DNA mismatch endonuclease (patch repair protein)
MLNLVIMTGVGELPRSLRCRHPTLNKSESMARVRTRDTEPELYLFGLLRRNKIRFHKHAKDLPGTPDAYIARLRIALFVHGCFWHGHTCNRGRPSATRVDFWREKIARNRQRDATVCDALTERGITPLVFWACAIDDFARRIPSLRDRYNSGAPK